MQSLRLWPNRAMHRSLPQIANPNTTEAPWFWIRLLECVSWRHLTEYDEVCWALCECYEPCTHSLMGWWQWVCLPVEHKISMLTQIIHAVVNHVCLNRPVSELSFRNTVCSSQRKITAALSCDRTTHYWQYVIHYLYALPLILRKIYTMSFYITYQWYYSFI